MCISSLESLAFSSFIREMEPAGRELYFPLSTHSLNISPPSSSLHQGPKQHEVRTFPFFPARRCIVIVQLNVGDGGVEGGIFGQKNIPCAKKCEIDMK